MNALDQIAKRMETANADERDGLLAIAENLERGFSIKMRAQELLTIADIPMNSMQSWEEAVYIPLADGVAVTTNAKTILVPDFTLPGNYLYPGRAMKYTLMGRMSTAITTPGTWTHTLNWGGVGGTVLATTAALAPDPTAAATNVAWIVEYYLTCRTIGTSGSVIVMGRQSHADNDDATTATLKTALDARVFPDAAAAVTINTTTANALTPAITPNVTTGSITCHIAILEAIT